MSVENSPGDRYGMDGIEAVLSDSLVFWSMNTYASTFYSAQTYAGKPRTASRMEMRWLRPRSLIRMTGCRTNNEFPAGVVDHLTQRIS